MAINQKKYGRKHTDLLRDVRPLYVRIGDWMSTPEHATVLFVAAAYMVGFDSLFLAWADLIILFALLYFWWLATRNRSLFLKLPMSSKYKDKNSKSGKPEGILYVGNEFLTKGQVWFSNSDARTHMLYLGTTGSGKTEGLKSMVSNALTWSSGFIYIDGKADTDLWSSLSALVRRFGRDDDLLVLNYMTGNSDRKAPSNTMNPFSSGSASYLTNLLVSLMPESQGDNAMWKERAVALIGALMPALTYKRDYQDIPTSVSTIRHYMQFSSVVALSRDETVPEKLRLAIKGYLDTLPGYVDAAFDDNGQDKPVGPGQPAIDTTTPKTQHGYLSMQFTRSLQSLGDDYGYIFDSQAADVEMVDIVLNRRILVVLIPALEKSGDEIANLGKIVAATLKGMMGSTLGSTVEGDSAAVIENKQTHSATPFMTVFDEVGYYTASGMAVMAAQARSLGFSLIFSSQDIPSMEKRVKEEAKSITANCNIKIFGKLEDPTQTKQFFEESVGSSFVTEVSGFQADFGSISQSYQDTASAGVQVRKNANYDALRDMKEGQAVVTFGAVVIDVNIFYSNPGFAKAMRVTRYMALPPPSDTFIRHVKDLRSVRDNLVRKGWDASKADVAAPTPEEFKVMADFFTKGQQIGDLNKTQAAMGAIAAIHNIATPIDINEKVAVPASAPIPSAIMQGEKQPVMAGAATSSAMPSTQAASPLSVFASPKELAASPETVAPKSWTELVSNAPPAQIPQQDKLIKLETGVRDILRKGALDARRKIMKKKTSTSDAAE